MSRIVTSTAIVATAGASPALGGSRTVIVTDNEIAWTEQGRVRGFKVTVVDARNNVIGGQYPMFVADRDEALATARQVWTSLRGMADIHPEAWARA